MSKGRGRPQELARPRNQDGATIETTQVPYAEALELCVTFDLSRSVALLKSRVTDAVEIHRLHGAPTTNGSAPVGIALMGERLLPRASDVEMPNLTVVDGSLIVDLGAATAGEAPPKTKRPKGTHPSVEHSKSVLEATSNWRRGGLARRRRHGRAEPAGVVGPRAP